MKKGGYDVYGLVRKFEGNKECLFDECMIADELLQRGFVLMMQIRQELFIPLINFICFNVFLNIPMFLNFSSVIVLYLYYLLANEFNEIYLTSINKQFCVYLYYLIFI